VYAVLFEPGRFSDVGMAHRVPGHEPKRDADKLLLATPYGHLLNELHRSPTTVRAAPPNLPAWGVARRVGATGGGGATRHAQSGRS
jgi:hypothetical protein